MKHNLYGFVFTPRIHLKYSVTEKPRCARLQERDVAADIFAENTNILTSSRELVVADDLQPEEGWNYGVSLIQNFFDQRTRWSDHTRRLPKPIFINQVVVDVDSDPAKIYVGKPAMALYSNVLQAEISYEPVKDLGTSGWRAKYVDAKETHHDMLMEVLLTNRYRGYCSMWRMIWKLGELRRISPRSISEFSRLPDLTGKSRGRKCGNFILDYFLL